MFNLNNIEFYCISMENDNGIKNWKRTKEDFNKQNIDIKKFNAINGKILELPKKCPYTNTQFVLNGGAYDCYLSHIEVIKIAKERNLDYVLIFEDDVKISEDFYDRLKYLESCNIDFDMFYFGGSFNMYTDKFVETSNKYIFDFAGAAGTHAYIVSKSIYDYILDNIRFDRAIDGFYATVIGKQPDDRLINKKYFDIKGFIPLSAGCYPNFSDLINQYTTNSPMNQYFKNKLDK